MCACVCVRVGVFVCLHVGVWMGGSKASVTYYSSNSLTPLGEKRILNLVVWAWIILHRLLVGRSMERWWAALTTLCSAFWCFLWHPSYRDVMQYVWSSPQKVEDCCALLVMWELCVVKQRSSVMMTTRNYLSPSCMLSRGAVGQEFQYPVSYGRDQTKVWQFTESGSGNDCIEGWNEAQEEPPGVGVARKYANILYYTRNMEWVFERVTRRNTALESDVKNVANKLGR